MKKLNYLLFTIFLLMILTSINSQKFKYGQAYDADEVIEKYIENIGGFEKLENIKSIKTSMIIFQMGIDIPYEQYMSSEKMYSKFTIQGQEIKQGVFNGETLWSTNFMSGKAEKNDQEAVKKARNQLKDFPDPFFNYKEKGFTAKYMGTEILEGSEVHKIRLTKTPNIIDGKEIPNIFNYFFDAENYMIIMRHQELTEGPSKGAIMEMRMSDFRKVDGLYLPFSITQGVKDQPSQTFTIKSYEINAIIDENEFEFPETKADDTPKGSKNTNGTIY